MSGYFNNVKEENGGDYTCTRHYRRHGQLYNMTFTVQLDVDSKSRPKASQKSTSRGDRIKRCSFDLQQKNPQDWQRSFHRGRARCSTCTWVSVCLKLKPLLLKPALTLLIPGSPLVVHCKAVMYFYESESLFWLNGDDGFVGTEESLPVFFNSTR